MKKHFTSLLTIAALAGCALSGGTASAMSIVENYNYNPGTGIPDGDPNGLADVRTITGSEIIQIESIKVGLNISGTWNGDLYAYLTHSTGFSILLNRSGRTAAETFGYGDDGYDIVLDDLAILDIHTYQDSVTPAAGNPLTGTWQPDGRAVDPDLVEDSDTPTAMLSSFVNLDANGDWILFVADLSGGATHTLNNWSLEITGIPEPSSVALLFGSILLCAVRRHRKR